MGTTGHDKFISTPLSKQRVQMSARDERELGVFDGSAYMVKIPGKRTPGGGGRRLLPEFRWRLFSTAMFGVEMGLFTGV